MSTIKIYPHRQTTKSVTLKIRREGHEDAYERVEGTWEIEGKRRADEIIKRYSQGIYAEPSAMLLVDYLNKWRAERFARGKFSRTTNEIYEANIAHIARHLGTLRLQRVDRHDMQRMYDDLQKGAHGRKAAGPFLIARIHRMLHPAIKDAIAAGLRESDPLHGVERPPLKSKRGRHRAIDLDDIDRVLSVAVGHWMEDIIRLAFATGMRRSEICGLKWQDIKLAQGRLLVRRQFKGYRNGEHELAAPKSEAALRPIPLDGPTLDMLRARQERAIAETWEARHGRIDDLPVFPDHLPARFGQHRKGASLSSAFRVIADKAGLSDFRFHDERHTHATLALRTGADPKTVARRIGHANPMTTMTVYQTVTEADEDKVAAQVGEVLAPVLGKKQTEKIRQTGNTRAIFQPKIIK